MDDTHAATEEDGSDSGKGAVAAWFRSIHHGDSWSSDLRFADQEDGSVWVTFVLSNTRLAGGVLAPIVMDFGADCWLQAWADGEVLTLCAPSPYLGAAVGCLGLLAAGVSDGAGGGHGETLSDGESRAE